MTTTFEPAFAPPGQCPGFASLFPTSTQEFAASLWALPKPPPPTPEPLEEPAPEPEEEVVDVVAEAQAEAARLLSEARARAEELVVTEAQRAAEAARQEQLEAFGKASEALLASLEAGAKAQLAEIECEMALLLSRLLERIVHQRIAADDEAIVSLTRAALQRLADSERVQVVVAPQHEPTLRHAYDDLAAVLREDGRLELIVSDTAEEAGCVAHGDRESIDARLSTRLEAIDRTVRQTVLGDAAA